MPNLLNDKLSTLDEEQVAKLYQNLFDSEEGKLVLQDLKNRCFIDISTYDGGNMEIHEGMRCVVLHIQTQLNYEVKEKESDE